MPKENMNKLLLDKLDKLEKNLDKVRTEDLPKLHTAMSVIETRVEERTGRKATLITAVGGAIAVLTSIGITVAASMMK